MNGPTPPSTPPPPPPPGYPPVVSPPAYYSPPPNPVPPYPARVAPPALPPSDSLTQAEYSLPSLPWLVAVGIVKAVWLFVVLVFVPYEFLTLILSTLPITLHYSLWLLIILGGILAALVGVAHVLKPTSLYGPVTLASSGIKIAYLLILADSAGITIALSTSSGSFYVYLWMSTLLYLIMIAAGFAAVAAAVTTLEDLKHPKERLPFDFPPKHRPTP